MAAVAMLIGTLAAGAAAGAVYAGKELDQNPPEIQLPESIKQFEPTQDKPDSTQNLSIENVDTNLEIEKGIEPETSSAVVVTPEPVAEPVAEPPEPVAEPPEPVTPATSEPPEALEVPETEAESEPSAPTEVPEVPEEQKGGAQIGRPPWGEITSSVISTGQTGGTGGTESGSWVTKAFSSIGYVDPSQLQAKLREVRDKIRAKQIDINTFEESIKEKTQKVNSTLTDYAKSLASKSYYDKVENFYKQKLDVLKDGSFGEDPDIKEWNAEKNKLTSQKNLQPNQPKPAAITGGDDKKDRIKDLEDKIAKRKTELRKLLEEDPEKLIAPYRDAIIKKEQVAIEFNEIERKRKDALESYGKIEEERKKKQDELKALKKEEEEYLTELLRFKPVKKDESILTIDFNKRRDAYFDAKDTYDSAVSRYNNYLTAELNRDPDVLEKFKQERDFSKKLLEKSIALLTEIDKSQTFSSLEFSKFTRDIRELFTNAITGKIGDTMQYAKSKLYTYWWGGNDNGISNYFNSFQVLLAFLGDERVTKIANMYYLTKKEEDIERNVKTYLDFFRKYAGQFNPNSTQAFFQDFQASMTNAHSSIRSQDMPTRPNPAGTQDQYKKLRILGMAFIDKQVFAINRFIDLVDNAYSKAKYEGSSFLSSLEELKDLVQKAIKKQSLEAQCEQILDKSIMDLLSSGIFDKEKVNGKDEDLKIVNMLGDETKYVDQRQKFFDKIGFVKIDSLDQLADYFRENGSKTKPDPLFEVGTPQGIQNTRIEFLRRFPKSDQNIPDAQKVLAINQTKESLLIKKYVLSQAREKNLVPEQLHWGPNFNPIAAPGPAGPPADITIVIRPQAGAPQVPDLNVFYDKDTFERCGPNHPNRIQLKDIKFPTGNFLKTRTGLDTIQTVLDSCEVDGNVGRGTLQNDTIKSVLEKLRDFGIEPLKKGELDQFIEQETKAGRINPSRNPVRKTIRTLFDVGFIPEQDYSIFSVLKTWGVDDSRSILYAFLECKSKKFSSIPYDSQTIFKSVRRNAREVFVELFMKELGKTTPFRDMKDPFKKEEDVIKGLALQFNTNIIRFLNKPELHIEEVKPSPQRYGSEDIYMFKDKQNIHYPIELREPALPTDRVKDDYDLSRFMGGAIDSKQLKFDEKEAQEKFEQGKKKYNPNLLDDEILDTNKNDTQTELDEEAKFQERYQKVRVLIDAKATAVPPVPLTPEETRLQTTYNDANDRVQQHLVKLPTLHGDDRTRVKTQLKAAKQVRLQELIKLEQKFKSSVGGGRTKRQHIGNRKTMRR